jgi:aspartate/methionine/tyrosine aminotransferase
VTERLLEKAHVAVVPGSAFGCPECIRLSYAISTGEIEEAMRRIKRELTEI